MYLSPSLDALRGDNFIETIDFYACHPSFARIPRSHRGRIDRGDLFPILPTVSGTGAISKVSKRDIGKISEATRIGFHGGIGVVLSLDDELFDSTDLSWSHVVTRIIFLESLSTFYLRVLTRTVCEDLSREILMRFRVIKLGLTKLLWSQLPPPPLVSSRESLSLRNVHFSYCFDSLA